MLMMITRMMVVMVVMVTIMMALMMSDDDCYDDHDDDDDDDLEIDQRISLQYSKWLATAIRDDGHGGWRGGGPGRQRDFLPV